MSVARTLGALGIAVLALLGAAAPAAAHGGAVESTDYRARIRSVSPSVPGLDIGLIEAGGRLELTNRTGEEAIVLGYENEPYLRVGPDGVYENRRSPAVYLNATRTGGRPVPDEATAEAEPRWVRIGPGPTARWHDHRVHWMTDDPIEVRERPGSRHRVAEWVLPVRLAEQEIAVQGDIVYVPGPAVWPWLLGAAALALAVVVGSVVAGARRAVLGVAVLALVATDVVRVTGLTLVLVGDTAERLQQAVDVGLLSFVGWGLGAAAAARLAAGHDDGRILAGLAGVLLAVTGGILEWDDFGRSQLAFVFPADLARLCVAAVTGLGLGIAAAVLVATARPTGAGRRRGR